MNPTSETKSPSGSFDQNEAGRKLKKAREARGLSLDAVHEATKIPMDALKGIEDGYTVRSLSPFYHRGFLKIYAQYLHEDVYEMIESQLPLKAPAAAKPLKIDLNDFKIEEWTRKVFTPERNRQIFIGVAALVGLFLVVKVFGFIGNAISGMKAKKESSIETPVQKKETVKSAPRPVKKEVKKEEPKEIPVEESKPIAVNKALSIAPITTAPTSKGVVLTVRSPKSSWLTVKVDGAVVFQSTLGSGAAETWSADDKIEISGRNLNQLEFELNGKHIGKLSKDNRSAKRIVVTSSGLSAN